MSQILRIQRVIKVTGLSRSSIYRLEREGDFPSRRRLGPNSVGWIEDEVVAWMRALTRPQSTDQRPGSRKVGPSPV